MKYVQVGILICLIAIVALLGARYFEQPATERAAAAEVEPELIPAVVEPAPLPAPETATVPAKPEPAHTEKPRPPHAGAAAPAVTKPVSVPEPVAPLPPAALAEIAEAPRPIAADPMPPVEEPPLVKNGDFLEPRTVTLPVGLSIMVRLNHTVSTERNQAGDDFQAVLDEPLIVDGLVIAEKGAEVEGKVVQADRAGRVKGRALLVLELTNLATQDGQIVAIETQYVEQEGPSTQKKDAAKVGIGAGIGAAIGAVLGGGKGAGIGAATGAGAGAGTVAATRGEPVVLRPETRLEFRLNRPVSVTEKKF